MTCGRRKTMRKNKDVKCKIHINNIPYELDRYTVVRATDHEFWFGELMIIWMML